MFNLWKYITKPSYRFWVDFCTQQENLNRSMKEIEEHLKLQINPMFLYDGPKPDFTIIPGRITRGLRESCMRCEPMHNAIGSPSDLSCDCDCKTELFNGKTRTGYGKVGKKATYKGISQGS